MKIFSAILSLFLLITVAKAEAKQESILFKPEKEPQLHVNNRILAKVHGKPISVVDLMKKMDMIFYKQFPEYSSSIQARFQFYSINWRHFLEEMIDKELIVADAEENKMKVSQGDVRQEMEHLFGPNIIANLDKIGLTFEEAFEIIKGDIIIRRMVFVRVTQKAQKAVTPQAVREAYEEYAKANVKEPEWQYYVISVRDKDAAQAAEAANLVYSLLTEDEIAIDKLSEKVAELKLKKSISVNVSEELQHSKANISEAYRDALASLTPNSYSHPLRQRSRDKTTLYRIFYLKDQIAGGVVPFQQAEPHLKNMLLEQESDKLTKEYLDRLRKHYDIKEEYLKVMAPEDFEPFSLS